MPTYTNWLRSSSGYGQTNSLRGCVFLVYLALFVTSQATVRGEEFAQPPQWTDEMKGVFFDDAGKELKGEPPTQVNAQRQQSSEKIKTTEQAVWRELITAATLESLVKSGVLRVNNALRTLHELSRSSELLGRNQCRRDLTLLGTLFKVIAAYPGEVRWKTTASSMAQRCLSTAESCAAGTHGTLLLINDTLVALEDVLRGQTNVTDSPATEPLVPDFTQLMQWMKLIAEDGLPTALSKKTDFRRNADSIAQSAQLLAMLSQVIRGEEYGYADDETYQAHGDKLRDAAKQLNEAATSKDFDKAVQAAAAIQKSCADCHADYRG